jgi:hypothetical protein
MTSSRCWKWSCLQQKCNSNGRWTRSITLLSINGKPYQSAWLLNRSKVHEVDRGAAKIWKSNRKLSSRTNMAALSSVLLATQRFLAGTRLLDTHSSKTPWPIRMKFCIDYVRRWANVLKCMVSVEIWACHSSIDTKLTFVPLTKRVKKLRRGQRMTQFALKKRVFWLIILGCGKWHCKNVGNTAMQATSSVSDLDDVNFPVTVANFTSLFWVSSEKYRGDLTTKY